MNTIVTTTEIKLDSKPVRTGNAKAVYCITDGKVYASGADAAKANGASQGAVSGACIGLYKTVKGKKYCYVNDMHKHVLEISNAMQDAVKDANIYRAKEAYNKKISELNKEIEARKKHLIEEQEKLLKAEAMYAAMEAEFNV